MGVIEIIKFALTCLGSFITAFGFFAGFWRAYKKNVEDKITQKQKEADEKIKAAEKKADEKIDEAEEKIKEAEEDARQKIDAVRVGSIAKTERLEKRISTLEQTVLNLQKDVSANIGQRMANIEGTMKGMSNILNQIQAYFINHTGDK